MRVIDAHVHVWSLASPEVTWPGPDLAAIHRDFALSDLRAEAGAALDGVVLVQSQPDDADTDRLTALAEADPLVLGVVGWVDLASPHAPARIKTLAQRPKLKGLRPMLQAIADTDWILSSNLEPALTAMVEHGLRFDALVQPRHLPALRRFAERRPGLPIVIDHGAKPRMTGEAFDAWREGIDALAALPHVHAKLSGLRTEQAPGAPAADLAPYAETLASAFGERLMWGSDWPVLRLAGDAHPDWLASAAALCPRLRPQTLFRDAAAAFYGLSVDRPSPAARSVEGTRRS